MFGRRHHPVEGLPPARTPSTPTDTLVWAVGDVHGCADLLSTLVEAVLGDVETRNASHAHLIFLGDYIDRGPDTKGVLRYLAALEERAGLSLHFLKGNHEDRMQAFLADPAFGTGWSEFGGREALASYGLQPPGLSDGPDVWEAARDALAEVLTPQDQRFLAGLKLSVSVGDYFFVHAGAEPGVALDEQDAQQLLWIRRRFLEDPRAFDKIVVHGHTPSDAVFADHRRIGIDTGAYATGVLTGLRLDGEARQLLQTRRRGGRIDLERSPLVGSVR